MLCLRILPIYQCDSYRSLYRYDYYIQNEQLLLYHYSKKKGIREDALWCCLFSYQVFCQIECIRRIYLSITYVRGHITYKQ